LEWIRKNSAGKRASEQHEECLGCPFFIDDGRAKITLEIPDLFLNLLAILLSAQLISELFSRIGIPF